MAKKKKGVPLNKKIVDGIFAGWKYKPDDHPALQVIDNTMSSDNVLALIEMGFFELKEAYRNGTQGDVHEHIRKIVRQFSVLDYHITEEAAIRSAAAQGGDGATN